MYKNRIDYFPGVGSFDADMLQKLDNKNIGGHWATKGSLLT